MGYRLQNVYYDYLDIYCNPHTFILLEKAVSINQEFLLYGCKRWTKPKFKRNICLL